MRNFCQSRWYLTPTSVRVRDGGKDEPAAFREFQVAQHRLDRLVAPLTKLSIPQSSQTDTSGEFK